MQVAKKRGLCGPNLLALFDFEDLVSGETVGFFVDLFTCFFTRSFEQTEYGPLVLVHPVIQVFYTVFVLDFDVLLMGLYDILNASINVSVYVHV